MPLRLISGGERVVASGTSGVGVMSRITAATRSRRESDAYKSCWFMTLTFKKNSATSCRPRHSHSNDDTSVASDSDECVSNAGSYAETEVDSSPEQDMLEDTQSQPSRLHLAVRNEVYFFLTTFHCLILIATCIAAVLERINRYISHVTIIWP